MASFFRTSAIWVALLYGAAALSISIGEHRRIAPLILAYAETFAGIWMLVGLLLLLRARITERDRGGDRHAWHIARDFIAGRWKADRCVSIAAPFAVAITLLSSYTFMKQFLLPEAGFPTGPLLAAGERELLGMDPWQITHALFGSPLATKALDLAYHAWFLPMILGVALCSFCAPGSIPAARYLLCYALLWPVQGSLIAYLLPAAGPCYFHIFQLDKHRFDGLMMLLNQQDLWLRQHGLSGLSSLVYQDKLLELFGSSEAVPGAGISAMPSMHNALATLFACAGFSINRRLGYALSAYCGIILVASVHLGWHYLSDGLVAIAATILIWRLTGALAAFKAGRTAVSPQSAPAAAP